MIRRFAGLSLLLLAACEIEIGPDGRRHSSSQERLDRETWYEPAPPPREEPESTEYTRLPGGDPCVDAIATEKELVVTHPSVVDDARSSWAFDALVSDETHQLGPLRLLAIVNRPDLRATTDGCPGTGGELRFVYAALETSTVIVEIPWPASRTPRAWTEAWHALAEHDFGPDYNDALECLTDAIVADAPASTWKIRTNERGYGGALELRSFELEDGKLAPRPSDGTCQTCHGPSAPALHHIAPSRSGATQISSWLEEEELPRRVQSVRAALCAPACGGDYR